MNLIVYAFIKSAQLKGNSKWNLGCADDAKFEDHIDASPSISEGVSSDCSVLMT